MKHISNFLAISFMTTAGLYSPAHGQEMDTTQGRSVRAAGAGEIVPAIDVRQIPREWWNDGVKLTNKIGFIADVNLMKVNITLANKDTPLPCDNLYDSNCHLSPSTYKCSSAYTGSGPLSKYGIPTALGRENGKSELLPNRNAIEAVRETYQATQKWTIAFNLGFFNLAPFTGRPSSNFKPVYQEACQLPLGTYTHNGIDFAGRHRYVMRDGSVKDRPFSTVVLQTNGHLRWTTAPSGNIDAKITEGEKAWSGVFLRRGGVNITSASKDKNTNELEWPDFIIAKANSVVGRTAIGWRTTKDKEVILRAVVIQPGNGRPGGATIEDIRAAFAPSEWKNVLLLDGAGSSQFASSKAATPASTPPLAGSERVGGNCYYAATLVASCTVHGDAADDGYVIHYYANWTPDRAAVPSQDWVDRRVGPMMIISEK